MLEFLMSTSITNVRHNLRPVCYHFLCHKTSSCWIYLPIFQSLKHTTTLIEVTPIQRRPIWTISLNLLKISIDWTRRSSSNLLRRNSNLRSQENMSIFPSTLKLSFSNNCSFWSGVKLNGYWMPPFRQGLLSIALKRSRFTPPNMWWSNRQQ